MSRLHLTCRHERFALRSAFTIARGSKSHADVVKVTLRDDQGHVGSGEGVPYGRYGESIASVIAAIEAVRDVVEAGLSPRELGQLMPRGAARSGVDAALIDLACKQQGRRAWTLLGRAEPIARPTCVTLSLDTPEAMGRAAAAWADRPWLKVKLGEASQDLARLAAVRASAPAARLIADANEGWTLADLNALAPPLAALGLEWIEQPLPASKDQALTDYRGPVRLCADESFHDEADLPRLIHHYRMVNVKLDKTGGLTAAMAIAERARAYGFDLMLGCMVGTSLAMAPATLLMGESAIIDLDGPLLLAEDRAPPLRYDGVMVQMPSQELWG